MRKHLLPLFLIASLAPACAGTVPPRQTLPVNDPPRSRQAEINASLATMAQPTPMPVATDYHLGPQDRLEITLFNVPAGEMGVTPRTSDVRVSEEGKIVLPLLGAITATGLTTTALEGELRAHYKTYLREPQVGVMVKEYRSQRVSVIGAVQRPGVFELTGPKTLVDLLAMAGGLSDKAGSQVHLLRRGAAERQRYVIDLRALVNGSNDLNLQLEREDVIEVPRAGTFFVDGAVEKPGAYPLERPYTLTQALATAGGLNHKEAKLSDVMIFRHRDFVPPEAIPVPVPEILAGSVPDPPVEANDVLFVPTSVPKLVVNHLINAFGMGLSVPLR